MSVITGLKHTVLRVGTLAMAATASMALLMSQPALASDKAKDREGAIATLEASASKEVLQDQVRVVFGTQAAGATAAEVNRQLSEALDQARANFEMPADVEVATGGFNVYLAYGKDNKPEGWTGSASLVVVSKNLEAVSSVIEHLGKSLAVSSVQFSLSRQARQMHEKSLIQDLAQELGQRAGLTAQAFGFKDFEIVALDFTGRGDFSPRPMMQRVASASMAEGVGPSVSLEPAMTTVRISVTGQIRLH